MNSRLRALTKDWPEKLLYAAVAVTVGFVWSVRSDVAELKSNKRRDDQQDAEIQEQAVELKMLWRYSAFAHDQINHVRHKLNLEPVDAPDFR